MGIITPLFGLYFFFFRGVLEEFGAEKHTEVKIIEARLREEIASREQEFEKAKMELKVRLLKKPNLLAFLGNLVICDCCNGYLGCK